MSAPLRLIANVGAEEGDAPPPPAAAPALRTLARLWRGLFEPPAFGWLPRSGCAVAWLNTEAAQEEARAAGLPLHGAEPARARRVHDKAFALRVAEREGLCPAALHGLLHALDPADLLPPEAGVRALEAHLARWPGWARARFTLKPRLGGSGRGRVAGRDGVARSPALVGALPRLAARGGALLEPWLERVEDLSALLHVEPGAPPLLLGTLRQRVSAAGVYRGHAGWVDTRARVGSGSRHDEALRGAAVLLAGAAAEVGYVGPGGLDAFSFQTQDGSETLRPVVEFNARFTAGCVALGWLRRALPGARERLGLDAGERLAFRFDLHATPGAPHAGVHRVDLSAPDEALRPALTFARDAAALAGPANAGA